jgi:hypothetical protein
MVLGLPDPDPLVRGMDPDPDLDPDSSITVSIKNSKKNLDSYLLFVTSFGLFVFKNYVNVPSKSNKQRNFFLKLVFCWLLEVQWRK